MKNYSHIAIEGNIGAGKTSLAKRLADQLKAEVLLEKFDENPFLSDYYRNPLLAFQVETHFLLERFEEFTQFQNTGLVSDYTVFKSLVFAEVTLNKSEYQLFKKLFWTLYDKLPKPDCLIYLHQPIEQVQENIKNRGREFEQKIESEFLCRLDDTYQNFLSNIDDIPILYLDMVEYNPVVNDQDFDQLQNILNSELSFGINRISKEKSLSF